MSPDSSSSRALRFVPMRQSDRQRARRRRRPAAGGCVRSGSMRLIRGARISGGCGRRVISVCVSALREGAACNVMDGEAERKSVLWREQPHRL